LIGGVAAVRILRLLAGEAARHQHLTEIGPAHSAAGDDAAITIIIDRCAAHGLAPREGIKRVRSQRAAAIRLAVAAAAQLRALGRIDAPEPDAVIMDIEGVAIDDADPPDEVAGGRRKHVDDNEESAGDALQLVRQNVHLEHCASLGGGRAESVL